MRYTLSNHTYLYNGPHPNYATPRYATLNHDALRHATLHHNIPQSILFTCRVHRGYSVQMSELTRVNTELSRHSQRMEHDNLTLRETQADLNSTIDDLVSHCGLQYMVLCDVMRCGVLQCSGLQHGAVWCCVVWCSHDNAEGDAEFDYR
jgi:hypothetical protein